ncbi:hypothetical protein E2320_020657, partial [Naja naja]
MSSALSFLCFHPSSETWESYINRATVFDTSTALLAPQTVKAVSWEDLQELLSNHYSSKPSRIARQHTFRRQVQAEGETISTYMAALRKAALHCGFRDLQDQLLDQ